MRAYKPVSLNKITWQFKGFGLNSYLIWYIPLFYFIKFSIFSSRYVVT